MGTVEIYILGQKYSVKGDAPEEHIKKLASYVNEKLQEVHSSSPHITPLKTSILAAITIADELFKARSEQERLTKYIEEKTDVLTALFE